MYQEAGSVNLSKFLSNPQSLQHEAAKLQKSIAWETMANRGGAGFAKYGTYFSVMWMAGLVYPKEARLLRSANFYWRQVDDIADNDKPLPARYVSRQEYLQAKKIVVNQLFSGFDETVYGDEEDILLADYVFVAKELGVDLKQDSFDLLESIIFDEERARERRLLTQRELNDYFELLDPACIKGALKVAREKVDPSKFWPLSMAVRTMFNLRDFPKDFKDGIINISLEDIRDYRVDLGKLEGRSTIEQLIAYEPMARWYRDQIMTGFGYLNESTRILEGENLKRITRFVLGLHFEGPTRKNLTRYAKMLAV